EREAPRRLEQRNRFTEFAGSARALVMDRRQERLSIEPCDLRERNSAFVRRQTRVSVYPPRRGLLERAHRCRMKRRAAAVTQRELSRAANLFGERSSRRPQWGRERPEPHAVSPERQPDERERQHHDRSAVLPHQR